MKTNILQITEVKKIKQKNMWTLRILKEPMKYQTIGGFLFRLFGSSVLVNGVSLLQKNDFKSSKIGICIK